MKLDEFSKVWERFRGQMDSLLDKKGADYSTEDDRLSSFKIIAQMTGQSPMQVWLVYFVKHLTAVMSYAKNGKVHSEPISSRFHDMAAYCVLGDALIREEQEARELSRPKEGVVESTRDDKAAQLAYALYGDAIVTLQQLQEDLKSNAIKGTTKKRIEACLANVPDEVRAAIVEAGGMPTVPTLEAVKTE